MGVHVDHHAIRQLAGQGLRNVEIARALGCSTKTVERVRGPQPHQAAPAHRQTGPCGSERTAAAAAVLLAKSSLGPIEFRAAIARWLTENAAVTKRMEESVQRSTVPTLACVLAILDVIEAAE